jgi:hypothetical protein
MKSCNNSFGYIVRRTWRRKIRRRDEVGATARVKLRDYDGLD